MILEMEDHYGVQCDFCGNNLHDKSLGGDLVTETPDEAQLLANHFEWFVEKDKHYCTKCVPSFQKIEEPALTRWAKIAFPSCTTDLAILTSLLGIIFLIALSMANIYVALIAALGYGVVIRYHIVLHQRNELANALLTFLEDDEEE